MRRRIACLLLFAAVPALAADEPFRLELTIRNHRFEPVELRAPAGTPLVITVFNADETPEEFESAALQVERIITGGRRSTFRIKPQDPGRYPFMGDFNQATAKGVLIIEAK